MATRCILAAVLLLVLSFGAAAVFYFTGDAPPRLPGVEKRSRRVSQSHGGAASDHEVVVSDGRRPGPSVFGAERDTADDMLFEGATDRRKRESMSTQSLAGHGLVRGSDDHGAERESEPDFVIA